MAFIKIKQTRQGFSAGYWKLTAVTVDVRNKEASMIFCLYASKEMAEDSEAHIDTIGVSLYEGIDTMDENLDVQTICAERFDKYFSIEGMKKYKDLYNASYKCAKKICEYFTDAEDF